MSTDLTEDRRVVVKQTETPIVGLQHFIEAIRDAGYRGTGSAISELVDNAFEAGAKRVQIQIDPNGDDTKEIATIAVTDDGCGMTDSMLQTSLQFGGSSRFGSRRGTGRFGMGLPNSSVSQARRVDVYSWQHRHPPRWSFLDVDEILAGERRTVPRPATHRLPAGCKPILNSHGTLVVWSRCDRVSPRRSSSLLQRLHKEIGRVFRFALWEGRVITLNGEPVLPHDPLFLRKGSNLLGATQYGPDLEYSVRVPTANGRPTSSRVIARFSELPVERWQSLSNDGKRRHGISKNAGVSVVRAGREVDSGWYFMGGKRKENYDDWWRCEVEFQPELDDGFGVTHTKQGINPTEQVTSLLAPDFERIAHILNSNVRRRFLRLKASSDPAACVAAKRDAAFEPPASVVRTHQVPGSRNGNWCAETFTAPTFRLTGLTYSLAAEDLKSGHFFISRLDGSRLTVILNRQHPFFERVCSILSKNGVVDAATLRRRLELLILAAGRAEAGLQRASSVRAFQAFRASWSDILAAFLS